MIGFGKQKVKKEGQSITNSELRIDTVHFAPPGEQSI